MGTSTTGTAGTAGATGAATARQSADSGAAGEAAQRQSADGGGAGAAGAAGIAEAAQGAAGATAQPGGPAVATARAEETASSSTPAALLLAARKLFAEHGYEGASVRAITAAADANLGAVTYHFGSKKVLYNRVVEMCVAPLVTRVEAALAQPVPVLDRLEGVIRAYFDHFAENPDLPHLMLQEIVLGGGPPEAAGPFLRRIYALIVNTIREGQASGELRPGDPTLMGLSLISQPIFPMVVKAPIQMITGMDLHDAHTRERVVAHVVGFARAGLAARPEEAR